MPCIQRYAVNPLNFLRWHPAADLALPYAAVGLSYCEYPAHPCTVLADYDQDEEYPALPVVAGDVVRFFINSESPLQLPDGAAGLALGLVQCGVLVTALAGRLYTLAASEEPGADLYYLYGELDITCQADGLYNPVIYQTQDNQVRLLANPVAVVNRTNWRKETTWAKFRHPTDLYGVAYSELPGLYQEFRLDMSMYRPKFEVDEEVYTDRNNTTRTTSLTIGRVYELQTDFWDEEMVTAATLMLTHREVYLADKRVRSVGGFEPEYLDQSRLVTAKGKVSDQDFSRTVRPC